MVNKVFTDENGHAMRLFVNDKGLCFIECYDESNIGDVYYSQFVTLNSFDVSELIKELHKIKKGML